MQPLVLWGGTDVNASYYNQPSHSLADNPDDKRDEMEFAQVREHIAANTPCIGICRGAQLLCIANGGSLYQHSLGHRNNNHHLLVKSPWDQREIDGLPPKVISNVAADHHQIMNITDLARDEVSVLGWANFSTKVWINDTETTEISVVPEVVWFPKTRCLAIQPHPEWMNRQHEFNKWLDKLLTYLLGVNHHANVYNRM